MRNGYIPVYLKTERQHGEKAVTRGTLYTSETTTDGLRYRNLADVVDVYVQLNGNHRGLHGNHAYPLRIDVTTIKHDGHLTATVDYSRNPHGVVRTRDINEAQVTMRVGRVLPGLEQFVEHEHATHKTPFVNNPQVVALRAGRH